MTKQRGQGDYLFPRARKRLSRVRRDAFKLSKLFKLSARGVFIILSPLVNAHEGDSSYSL